MTWHPKIAMTGCIYELLTWLFEVYAIFPLWYFIVEILCMSIEIYWRCDVYFLNNCYIRVFYHFNKSRALHCALEGGE